MKRGRVQHTANGRRRTEEEVVGVRTRPANLEYLHHIEELAVDVTHDSNGRSDVHHIALFHEQLLGFGAYCLDHRLGEQLLLRQARYAFIEVYGSCHNVSTATQGMRRRRRLTYTVGRAWWCLCGGCWCWGIRGAAQGIESILVASRCLYRTIILGGASRGGIWAMARERATWQWGAMCACRPEMRRHPALALAQAQNVTTLQISFLRDNRWHASMGRVCTRRLHPQVFPPVASLDSDVPRPISCIPRNPPSASCCALNSNFQGFSSHQPGLFHFRALSVNSIPSFPTS